ncbi:MAG: HAD hydrolase-like protein [Mycoplasmoidaceae bacterium]|nr:HAD hydrolase-like protein [Mycoplasmoidaceae bacterium]
MYKIKKVIKKYHVKPEEVLFIGDQFLIDIFCANRFGAKSILVFPLTDVKYRIQKNKLLSMIEKKIYEKISLNNIITNSLENQSLDSYEII